MKTRKSSDISQTVVLDKREKAAFALASGCNEDEAANKSGAAARVIKTWLQTDRTFVHRIREIRSEISKRVTALMTDKMTIAVATLEELCRDARTDATRLAAAKLILEFGMRMHQNVEFEEEITMCEVSQQQESLLSDTPPKVSSEMNENALSAIAEPQS